MAGVAKLRSPERRGRERSAAAGGSIRLFAAGELGLGVVALATAGGPLRAALMAVLYAGFAVLTLRLARPGELRLLRRRAGPGLAAAVAAQRRAGGGLRCWPRSAAPTPLGWILAGSPGIVTVLALGTAGAVYGIVLAYSELPQLWRSWSPAMSPRRRLAGALGSLLERRTSRRGVLARAARGRLGVRRRPGALPGASRHRPMAVIVPGDCGPGQKCSDGYTAFCCEIEAGRNTCPENTYVAGWWKCTDYRGSGLCTARATATTWTATGSRATLSRAAASARAGDCHRRRVDCNHFRYGQCNTQVQGTTEVVCRLVVCQHPAQIPGMNCNADRDGGQQHLQPRGRLPARAWRCRLPGGGGA